MSANNASAFRKVINAEQYWVGRHRLQAGDILNSSSITGTTVEDALENLSGGGSGPLLTLNGAVGATQTFSTANTGTDFAVVTNTSTLDHQFRLPDANGLTARGVVSTGAQTFGGVKTFSSAPSLPTNTLTANGNLMTFPTSAQTLVGLTATQTLTNKTATDSSNNITATGLFTNAGTVNVSASGPPIANYVLMATGANAATWQPVSAAGSGILSINGLTDTAQSITSGTSGNDFNVTTSGTGTTVINLPDASTTKRGAVTTGTQSFIGAKTFTTDAVTFDVAPTLTSGTLTAGANLQTFPSSAQTLVGRTSTETLTNKSLVDATTYIIDDSVSNKIAQFDCSLLTAGATKTFQFPDASAVLVGDTNAQTVTNKVLTSATNNVIARGLWHGSGTGSVSTYAATAPGAGGGQVLATDAGGTTASWQTISSLGAITTLNTLTAATQTFAVGSAGTDFAISSGTATHTFNIPTAGLGISRGLVTNGSQTLYGAKTFNDVVTLTASPVLSTGTVTVGVNTVTVPNATDTLVGLATADSLTNKTMTSTSNNVTAKGLFVNGGTTVTVNASGGAPSANYVLMATSSTNAEWRSTAAAGVAITTLNTLNATTQTFATGTSGSDFGISSATSTHTFNIPDASLTARGLVTTGAQSFAGVKTFQSAPTLTSGTLTSITSTITFPTSNATLVGLATTDTLTNKSLVDASTYIVDDVTPTKIAQFQCSSLTGTKTFTFPNADMTFVGQDNSQTLTNKIMTGATNTLTASLLKSATTEVSISAATAPSANQVLMATGSSAATWQTISSAGVAITSLNSQTGTTQTFATGTAAGGGNDFNISSATNTHTFNLPDASGTVRGVVTTGTQTFAGAKTFSGIVTLSSAPVLSTGTITVGANTVTVPSATDTLVGKATTDTLTNKTATSNTNNLIARQLWVGSGAGSVSTYAATAPSSGQVLTATSSTVATWQTPSTSSGIGTSVYNTNFNQTATLTSSETTTPNLYTMSWTTGTFYQIKLGAKVSSTASQYYFVFASASTAAADILYGTSMNSLVAGSTCGILPSAIASEPTSVHSAIMSVYCSASGTVYLRIVRSSGSASTTISLSHLKMWSM